MNYFPYSRALCQNHTFLESLYSRLSTESSVLTFFLLAGRPTVLIVPSSVSTILMPIPIFSCHLVSKIPIYRRLCFLLSGCGGNICTPPGMFVEYHNQTGNTVNFTVLRVQVRSLNLLLVLRSLILFSGSPESSVPRATVGSIIMTAIPKID